MTTETESIKYFLTDPPTFDNFLHLTYRVNWISPDRKEDVNDIEDRLIYTVNLN